MLTSNVLKLLSLALCALVLPAAVGCQAAREAGGSAPSDTGASLPADAPLPLYKQHLLDVAYDASMAMPLKPHIKDRARALQAVAEACLELDAPARALRYTEEIPNWRRGIGYADYAAYLIVHGRAEQAQQYLDRAADFASLADQDWRRGRIANHMARAYFLMGQSERAKRLLMGITDESEQDKQGAARISRGEQTFDGFMKRVDEIIEGEVFEPLKNILGQCVVLHGRYYSNAARREALEAKLRGSWEKVPYLVRMEWLSQMTGSALEHGDMAKARSLIEEIQQYIDDNPWPWRFYGPLIAEVATLRWRAGQAAKARSQLGHAVAEMRAHMDEMINIDRAGAFRPLAEAYAEMGHKAEALSVYRTAVEQGVDNPNIRPRAQDLSATCTSMALHGVEPDVKLWGLILRISDRLRK